VSEPKMDECHYLGSKYGAEDHDFYLSPAGEVWCMSARNCMYARGHWYRWNDLDFVTNDSKTVRQLVEEKRAATE
jgi:hypothetical protein